jgi:hypothetical protein
MLGDDQSILTDYDAIGIGMDLNQTTDCTGRHRVPVQVFETDAGTAWNPSNPPA